MQLLVEELVVEPELELPLLTVITEGRSAAAIYVSCSVSVTIRRCRLGWLIGACRSMGGGGEGRASTWGCVADVDAERVMGARL